MPIYEYRCDACEHAFEEWQKINDPPIRKCPKCGAHRARKLISASGFQFKGTGWYVTDYGRNANPAPAGADASAESNTSKRTAR